MNLSSFTDSFLAGARVTLELGFASFALGVSLGLIAALASRSPFAFVRWLVKAYTTVMRGVPELLIIFLIYYGGTAGLSALFNHYFEVNPMSAGISALGIVCGAYSTEVIRGAFNSIHRGQIEAAHAFGMSRFKTLTRIELPQMWRFALPGLGNLWQSLLKDTALVSVVGLDDIMRKSKTAAEYTREPFTYYLAAAVIYLLITTLSMIILDGLERRSNRGIRREA